ncbi:MAG TPA: hypothetical protein VGR32_06010 [Brevundimonas sp.]|jgi:hypothetical protein|uniref:HAAS signaling domain-containing protein n=1 Tax=Brevundimonas sp. TaxID=1871086 RepID=UPI002DF65693|nr:hypothetical protein [Brevundimonas sp.]
MALIGQYLDAVAAQLPTEKREDIVAELRELILSRFEAREDELGRPLTEAEQEAILQEIGHPLVVAQRYAGGPDSLVGPELYPYWLFAVKAGLFIVAAVQIVGALAALAGGPQTFGQAIGQAFSGFFDGALVLIGVITAVAWSMERWGGKPRWMTEWRVKDLHAFTLADPARWGLGGSGKTGAEAPAGRVKPLAVKVSAGKWPGSDALFSLIFTGLFVAWWVGAWQWPWGGAFELGDQLVTVSGAPVWTALFAPILAYALAQMAVDLLGVIRPDMVRLRALLSIGLGVAGLALVWTIFQWGHWFDLTSADGAVAQVRGGLDLLRWETLDGVDQLGRSLSEQAQVLGTVLSFVLAGIGLTMVFAILGDLAKVARGR